MVSMGQHSSICLFLGRFQIPKHQQENIVVTHFKFKAFTSTNDKQLSSIQFLSYAGLFPGLYKKTD